MRLFTLFIALALLGSAYAADKRAMTVDDLWAMQRISQIAVSPDGKQAAFTVKSYSMEKNSSVSDIWLVSLNGNDARQLTTHPSADFSPAWRPDGRALAFLSNRSSTVQIHSLALSGGEAVQLSRSPVEIEDFIWAPDGKSLAFVARVFPECTDLQASAEKDRKNAESPIKATVTDRLMFRHWNMWTEGKRSHLFICTADGEEIRDLTPGDFDSPPLALGGTRDYAFSPDGRYLVYVANLDTLIAVSTNNDLFRVPIAGGQAINLTTTNTAVDIQPLFSPDGKNLLYSAMSRPGFEADQLRLMLLHLDTQERQTLAPDFLYSPHETLWAPDGRTIYFTASKHGRQPIFRLDLKTGAITEILGDASFSDVTITPDGRNLIFLKQSVDQPAEIFRYDIKNKNLVQLTDLNREKLATLELSPVEDFYFDSFDGKSVHGLMVKPPFFDPNATYPLVYLVHGGPQGMWSNSFHYRWNSALFAAPGYVVAMVNFRGSTGYGQEWTDAVSRDWGGAPYQDLMAGLDYLVANYPFIDSTRMVAAGASYGGFMINWIATHTDRFKALVSHAGVFDQRSMYGATEELWFPEWEFGGTPYRNPELYEQWSPSYHIANWDKFRTPTLVTHGQHDYRVPVTQGFQLFTALQRTGVPSRLVYFPDETHFISKPQNARLWWTEIFSWYDRWLK
ncbi:S9 family peptidase [candidate division KSB1 bacterium]|nr:S9 family peptidase [candidate division KSB1 bacterium]